ncbi:hypothetical protein FRC11_014759, partial [Ceratobasidium sp. 423]
SVVVPGRDRSGTVVGRPIWDTEGARQVAQPIARPAWSDADEAPAREVATTGRRGTITRRPRRERDTDGDDTEADADDQTGQQGERRTIGIVDAADGDGAMAMDMMGEGVGVGVVALEQNDDLAMGAPPGAPGAIGTPRARVAPGTELTPRAGIAPLGAGQAEQTVPEARRSVPVNPGPYGDEEVLFSLQLLAYLSKYPHVRQAFYETPSTLRALVDASNEPKPTPPPLSATAQSPNVFSLVERFTFRPSPSETTLPRLPHEIQYWAGVIMRNACRKDDQRGGIRQCANMLCGRWEDFPREFAKCRRCRKAKYCGKECQSKAWAEGHRFWCSAREEDDSTVVARSSNTTNTPAAAAVATEVEVPTRRGLTNTVTRALVNIAGGMTGRTTTNTQQTVPTNTPAIGPGTGFRFAATEQAGQTQGLFGTGGTPARAPTFQAGLARGAGPAAAARGVRPLALPSRTANPPSAGWTGPPRGGVAFFNNEPAQTADAGPSRRTRGPETARRRSGTMPSQGGSNQTTEANDPWNVVPVQRVSPIPSAPHTTPQHMNQPLDGEGDDMVLG